MKIDAARLLGIWVIARHLKKVLADSPNDVFLAGSVTSCGYLYVLMVEGFLGFPWPFQHRVNSCPVLGGTATLGTEVNSCSFLRHARTTPEKWCNNKYLYACLPPKLSRP